MLNTQESIRRLQPVITDLTQWPNFYEGGAALGINVVMEKANNPQQIRSLFVNYERARAEVPEIKAALETFWSLLGIQNTSLQDFLAEADRLKSRDAVPTFRKTIADMRVSILEPGNTATIRVDFVG